MNFSLKKFRCGDTGYASPKKQYRLYNIYCIHPIYAHSTHAHVSNKSGDAGGVIEIALLFTVLAACVSLPI
jgi:hypothetical protein